MLWKKPGSTTPTMACSTGSRELVISLAKPGSFASLAIVDMFAISA